MFAYLRSRPTVTGISSLDFSTVLCFSKSQHSTSGSPLPCSFLSDSYRVYLPSRSTCTYLYFLYRGERLFPFFNQVVTFLSSTSSHPLLGVFSDSSSELNRRKVSTSIVWRCISLSLIYEMWKVLSYTVLITREGNRSSSSVSVKHSFAGTHTRFYWSKCFSVYYGTNLGSWRLTTKTGTYLFNILVTLIVYWTSIISGLVRFDKTKQDKIRSQERRRDFRL